MVDTAVGPAVVANTHLSSDHSTDGAGLRAGPARAVGRRTSRDARSVPVVLVGDFNDDTGAPATRLGMTDAWTQVHGVTDETATFDPVANPLAAVSSLSGEAKRLDRVLLLGAEASDARLVGEVPDSGGLFISDHYGISAVIDLAASPALTPARRSSATTATAPPTSSTAIDATPTARTAVAWIPPTATWDPIQEVRHRLDPQVLRWPPHVNMLFGFIAESEFDAALPLLSKAAAAVTAFETQLGRSPPLHPPHRQHPVAPPHRHRLATSARGAARSLPHLPQPRRVHATPDHRQGRGPQPHPGEAGPDHHRSRRTGPPLPPR